MFFAIYYMLTFCRFEQQKKITFYLISRNVLACSNVQQNSLPNACGFQFVFHWVSKFIHLTEMRPSDWLITTIIISKFDNHNCYY